MELSPLHRSAPPRDLPAPRPVVVRGERELVQEPRDGATPTPKIYDDGLDVQITQHAESGALVTQVLDMLACSFATKKLRKDPS